MIPFQENASSPHLKGLSMVKRSQGQSSLILWNCCHVISPSLQCQGCFIWLYSPLLLVSTNHILCLAMSLDLFIPFSHRPPCERMTTKSPYLNASNLKETVPR